MAKEKKLIKKKRKFKLTKPQWIGLITAIVIVIISIVLWQLDVFDSRLFYFILGISIVVGGLPFILSLIFEAREEREKEQMFLEFTRDLVEGVRAGTPISKSILNVKTKNYGSLTPHVQKLANQISLGIPVRGALTTFSKDVNNKVVSRAITLIGEAERAGGKIETVLDSVVLSVSQIEKLRKERKAAIYNLTVQGYIIFFIFIIIMLVMQFKILPITSELNIAAGGEGAEGLGIAGTIGDIGVSGTTISPEEMSKSFLFLLIAQGFFAGLVIGKITEGRVKAGIKHSFILVVLAWLISAGANLLLI